jgi:hypothetical protein
MEGLMTMQAQTPGPDDKQLLAGNGSKGTRSKGTRSQGTVRGRQYSRGRGGIGMTPFFRINSYLLYR